MTCLASHKSKLTTSGIHTFGHSYFHDFQKKNPIATLPTAKRLREEKLLHRLEENGQIHRASTHHLGAVRHGFSLGFLEQCTTGLVTRLETNGTKNIQNPLEKGDSWYVIGQPEPLPKPDMKYP